MAFFKKGLVELMLLNGFFIYNNNFNIFFDTSTSIIFIDFKISFLIKKKKFSNICLFFFSTFQLDFIRSNDTFSKNLRRLHCALILR
jgi:hypothetical protein